MVGATSNVRFSSCTLIFVCRPLVTTVNYSVISRLFNFQQTDRNASSQHVQYAIHLRCVCVARQKRSRQYAKRTKCANATKRRGEVYDRLLTDRQYIHCRRRAAETLQFCM